jgi:ketosteroid isomerase-like protein
MSEQNVEVVRRIHDAAMRRDVETVLALYDPDVELDASRVQIVGQNKYRGHDGLRRFFGEWHEAWESIDYSFDELVDAGDQVVSVVTRRARGRASGADVQWPLALVWTLRDGRVIRLAWFPTRADALEAAGLPGHSQPPLS